jgi:hypothetical protein
VPASRVDAAAACGHRVRVVVAQCRPSVGPDPPPTANTWTPPDPHPSSFQLVCAKTDPSLHPVSPLLRRVESLSTFPPLRLLRRTRATKTERQRLLNVPSDVLSTPWCLSSLEGAESPPPPHFHPIHGENRHCSALLRFRAALTVTSLLRCCRAFIEPRSTSGAPSLP